MNIENLFFFIRVSELGGLAKAGREFGYSAATASTKLTAIEDYYDIRLVNRTTRSLSLTEEGLTFLERAKVIVAELNDLKDTLQDGRDRISGPMKLTSTHDFGQNTLAPLLDKFLEIHPNVVINLLMDDAHIDVISEGVDLAIRMGSLKDSTLVTRKIGDNYRVVCASPDYIKEHGMPQNPSDLSDHNCLGITFKAGIDNSWPFSQGNKDIFVNVTGNRIANSGSLVRQWCLAGQGIAYKSIWDVKEDLKAGRLVELLSDFRFRKQSSVQAVYPGGGQPPRRVTALMDYLSDHLVIAP